MSRKMLSSTTGGVCICFIFVVSFFFSVPLRAELVRGEERENLEAIFKYTMEITGEFAWKHAMMDADHYLSGLIYGDATRLVIDPTPGVSDSIWAWLTPGYDGGKYTGFAVSLETTSTDLIAFSEFLDSMTINGDTVVITDRPVEEKVELNYFYGPEFMEFLLSHQLLEFEFGNQLGEYTFTFYGLTEANIPEPATLTVLGLGLAGLGLARARQRKKK